MTFTTPSAYAPPTICGYETGHHIYLDSSRGSLTTNPVMTLAFTGKYLHSNYRYILSIFTL